MDDAAGTTVGYVVVDYYPQEGGAERLTFAWDDEVYATYDQAEASAAQARRYDSDRYAVAALVLRDSPRRGRGDRGIDFDPDAADAEAAELENHG